MTARRIDPAELRRLAESNIGIMRIAEALGANDRRVKQEARALGIDIPDARKFRGPGPQRPWTAELDARLAEMRAAGKPFAAIALDLGVRKNAAIGRAYRLGLAVSKCAGAPTMDGCGQTPPPLQIPRRQLATVEFPPPGRCVWPTGAGFCGDPCGAPGASYCDAHRRRAYKRTRPIAPWLGEVAEMPPDDAPLPENWEAIDSVGCYADAIDALRRMHRDGWQPPEGSPFRPREDAKGEAR